MSLDPQSPQSLSTDTTFVASPAPGLSDPAALPFENDKVVPWPEPVDGAQLLDDLVTILTRYVVLPKWAPQAVALFNVHTFAFHLRSITTYLGIESPEKRCGKTTLLKALTRLVNRPIVASNVSSSAFFRVIAEAKPTFIIDEADTILFGNDELRGILNSGYSRETAFVVRVANLPLPVGKAKPLPLSQLAMFSSWCPKAFASIGHLPDTLADRCILIRMHRKTPAEKCERLRNLDGSDLKRRCLRFVLDHQKEIAAAQPDFPPDLNDRASDLWEPLFAIADLAGAKWPSLARQAALALTLGAEENNPIASLLLDILLAFVCKETNRLFSRSILEFLESRPDRPWADLRKSSALNELWLARILRPYGVRPRSVWIDGTHRKGYLKEDFREVFARYIPKSEIESLCAEMEAPASPLEAPGPNPQPHAGPAANDGQPHPESVSIGVNP